MPPNITPTRNNKPAPDELGDDLIAKCKEFLSIQIPVSNVVFVDEFSKFMPLFNKNLHDRMDTNEVTELCKEYYGRFSMQHPIQVLRRERDEKGVMHPNIRERFKLEVTIPAMFRRVSSLNDLGEKVPALINAFFNATTQPSSPFDKRKEDYAHAISEAIALADKKSGGRREQEELFAQQESALVKGDKSSQDDVQDTGDDNSSDTSPMSGLSLWG